MFWFTLNKKHDQNQSSGPLLARADIGHERTTEKPSLESVCSDLSDESSSLTIVQASNDAAQSTLLPQWRDQQLQAKMQSADSSVKQHTEYPWSKRSLFLPYHGTLSSTSTLPSLSPLPRYGASLFATATGELFLFGGLVGDQRLNDLYLISATDLSTTLVETTGEIPPPRVGHASALVGSVLIVFGGDTKDNDKAEQDNGMYLLNLVSREWTCVTVDGPAAIGRYGHAVAMVGATFYMFGGQIDGEFLNDLWAFDLNSLRTKTMWEPIIPAEGSPKPPPRTGHIFVAVGEKIIMFGGADCQYHYNDTWIFDTNTHMWSESMCIGFIPQQREAHTAAVVDDVVYIFGGRGADGKDLGDLGAFRLSNQRWYMFQNMGPTPIARTGHAMAAIGSRIFVAGGLGDGSDNVFRYEDASSVHVLDTEHIGFPSKLKNGSPTSYAL